ncbi:MAG: DUF5671 domain-containing protein, partial [Chloroflexi bacterium]|nr:DUF5671 domain-containing protein [Chloroflexota bacterium]
MVNARRFYLYVMAFVGLQSVLIALAGMLALLMSALLLQSHTLLGGKRTEASFYLAALVVGLPIWLVHRFFAEREAARMAPEQRAPLPRRLFYAAVLGTTMVVTIVALQSTLRFLLSLLVYTSQFESALEGTIRSGTYLVVFGLAGLFLNRVSPSGAGRGLDAVHDEVRDFARFVVAGLALVLFALGLGRALRLTCTDLLLIFGDLPQVLAGPRETIASVWIPSVAGVLSGGIFSAVIWRNEYRRRFACTMRALFLSLAIIAAAAITLLGSVWIVAELLRRLLGYRSVFDTWSFVRDWLPFALVGGLLWTVHWLLLRQQAEFRRDGSAEASRIPWPRRPVLAVLALLGLVTMAPALASLLWLWFDGVFHTGIALVGVDWWQKRLSFGLAAAVAGGVLWIGTWRYLERALATGAVEERRSTARRFLLGFVTLAAASK